MITTAQWALSAVCHSYRAWVYTVQSWGHSGDVVEKDEYYDISYTTRGTTNVSVELQSSISDQRSAKSRTHVQQLYVLLR